MSSIPTSEMFSEVSGEFTQMQNKERGFLTSKNVRHKTLAAIIATNNTNSTLVHRLLVGPQNTLFVRIIQNANESKKDKRILDKPGATMLLIFPTIPTVAAAFPDPVSHKPTLF
jgi:hypothetical protein